MHMLKVVGLLSFVVLTACSFKSGPEEALLEIQKAVETKDAIKFERYVDLDTLLSHALDSWMAEAMAEMGESGDGFEALGAALGVAMIEKMKPSLVQKAKQSILAEFGGAPSAAGDGPDVSEEFGELYGNATTEWELAGIREDGPLAIVSLLYRAEGETDDSQVDLKMQRVGEGDWRVTEIANIADIIALSKAREERRAAERQVKLDAANAEIKAQIAKHLVVEDVSFTTRKENFEQSIQIRVDMINPGTDAIENARLKLAWSTAAGAEATPSYLTLGQLEARGKTTSSWSIDVNPFYDQRSDLFADIEAGTDIPYTLDIDSITLANGTVVALLTSLPN